MKLIKALALAAPLVMLAPAAYAGPVASGFDAANLAANDDNYSGSINTGLSMNFYGTTYTNLFVNNNGNVTFGSGSGAFTPFGLGAGYVGDPIIAPFFGDVDTRGGGGLTSWGTGAYNGRSAFGVTWPGVGYYNQNTDQRNVFQLILTDRSDVGAGDFDIYFNYDQIHWETGDASGGNSGFGGSSAAVGFSNGTGNPGTYFQFAGSLVPGSFIDGGPNALAQNTNDGVTGQYLFQVRNGAITEPNDPGAVPEPATWAMMLMGFFGLGSVLRRSRRTAQALA